MKTRKNGPEIRHAQRSQPKRGCNIFLFISDFNWVHRFSIDQAVGQDSPPSHSVHLVLAACYAGHTMKGHSCFLGYRTPYVPHPDDFMGLCNKSMGEIATQKNVPSNSEPLLMCPYGLSLAYVFRPFRELTAFLIVAAREVLQTYYTLPVYLKKHSGLPIFYIQNQSLISSGYLSLLMRIWV
jgi:hypothetical protein